MTQQQETGTQRQNIEQERGRQAWEDIREIKDQKPPNKDLEKKYRSLARGLNAMIQINGLGQTLGFLKAKSKEKKAEHFYLLKHLSQWMRNHFSASNIGVMGDSYDGFLSWVLDKDTSSADYRRATTECLAFGNWLRRFAEAELEEPKPGEV
jgi:CRISPR-associated protein Cmr5